MSISTKCCSHLRRSLLLLQIIISLFVNGSPNAIAKEFKEGSHRLIDYLVKGDGKNKGMEWLEPLVDDFGHRHLGTKALESAIDFTVDRLTEDGFQNVHTERVENLPHWVRGPDAVTLIQPRKLKLNALAVAGTKPADVTAPVVVLTELDQLDSFNVSGKIVVFCQQWLGYGQTTRYRRSASIVEARGAVGVLIKSVSSFSLSSPHTGSGATNSSIPALCITLEEAELLERLSKRNKNMVIRINTLSDTVGEVTSRNTVFEITGSKWPEEIILLSGHMDTWDVGQGALDDGGGIAAVWQAMYAILKLGKTDDVFIPKRTIRGVFWTAEEQGELGASAYYERHKNNSNEKFFFVSETDQGAFRPTTYGSQLIFMGSEKHRNRIQEIVRLLNAYGIPLSVSGRLDGNFQGDVVFWANDGVPSVNYVSEKGIEYYFYFHHTQADYLSIFKEGDIDYTAAIFGVLAHVLSNMDSWD
ncbi:peptidase family m28 domain-containing protein [Ditylenchus destructor]|nr:peptidase family m28 domain-containing protein [Ditylenchus destructor]